MKKSITILLALTIFLITAAGCSNNNKGGASASPTVTPAVTNNSATGNPTMTSSVVLTGFGTDISIKSSKGVSTDASNNPVNALAQADVIMAAVAIDEGGKILDVKFDAAQPKINFDDKGSLVTDVSVVQQTKKELGVQYGMKQASGIGKEWYEQAAALEQWMKGKTVDQAKAMKTTQKDANHPAVPDEADLTSSVTISVDGFLRALDKASKNAKDYGIMPAGTTKTGLGTVISISKSKGVAATDGTSQEALGEADITMVAVTVDSAGKIVGVYIDAAQQKVNFSAQGQLTTDVSAVQKTKVELGDNYGMKKASGIGKEWYEQAAALGSWMLGKTAQEVLSMKTKQGGDHPGVPDEADLTSSVTISVTEIIAAFNKAVADAS